MRMQIEQWNDRDSDEGEAIDDYLKSVKWKLCHTDAKMILWSGGLDI